MSNSFFCKRTNDIEVKAKKLTAQKTDKSRTSQETLLFYDWFISILNLLHASVSFDPLYLLQRIVFC